MMDWLLRSSGYPDLVLVLLGILAEKGTRYIRERIDKPYRYKCPERGCGFRVASSSEDLRDKAVLSHIQHIESKSR